jgi:oxygen-independent coproporphyrinogen-3 oxidase
MGKTGVYIQVPFCQTKCTYCNFHTGVVSAGRFVPYAEAVCREIREHAALLRAAGVEWGEGLEPVSQMLQATSLRISGVETPQCAGLCGTAEKAAEKGSKAFPQGRFAPWAEAQGLPSPKKGRALVVGAKAPTPSAAGRTVVDTVYIGGGTPSLLEAALLADMLRALRETFACAWEEVTLEADPETIEAEKAAQWVAAGINRISLGTQSFVDGELQAAGRLHRREDIYKAVPTLREVGICNISFDLIAGLPKQSRESWRTSLDELVALSPEHVSVYMMEIDEGSRLGLEVLRGGARYSARDLPSEEEMAEFYETAQAILKAAGYEQYEISNWAKPGYTSRHNLKYWRREAYLGFGAGAHSFAGTQRWANLHDAAAYVAAISAGRSATESVERVTREQALEEELFLGLRQLGGIDLPRIQREYSVNLEEKVGRLALAGMIEREGELVRLAAEKLSVSNEVIVELLR